MPIYDFKCGACETTQEHILSSFDATPPPCDACEKPELVRLFSGTTSVRFERTVGWDGWDLVAPNTVGRYSSADRSDEGLDGRLPGSRKIG